MKTVKQMLLTIAVLLCSAAVNAHDFEVDGIFYNILDETEKTAEVTFKGSSYNEYKNEYTGSVVIPASVIYSDVTYSVTTIGGYAFYGCSGLTSITIPNSVTTIGNDAFANCSGLTSITIPNSVTTIGKLAFRDCRSLTSITIPNSVTTIENYAFYNCSGLTSITIPNSVTTIENYAFYNCSGLTSITIPNSVTTIGESAFSYCSGLTSIVVEEGNSHYDSRDNCNAIIETSTNTLIIGCKNTVIPNSVTTIGSSAFYDCSGLTSITIPNSVTTIGNKAFSDCSGLASIVVEEGNSHYDSRDNCNAIIETSTNTLITGCKNTVIPNSVTTIGYYAFWGCSGLTSITIPNSVTTIGKDAFYKCSGLTSVTIPNSVTSIGSRAFDNTAWYNNQPDGVVYAGKVLYKYKGEMPANTSIVVKDGTLGIAGNAFYNCTGLTSITIGNSVTTIGDYAFYGCSGLTSITIPNSVTTIGDRAFSGCI